MPSLQRNATLHVPTTSQMSTPLEKLPLQTPNLTQTNISRIRELFPNCVTERRNEATGKLKYAVDFDQLRQELSGEIVEGPKERYQLTWPGKRQAILNANRPIRKTLRPARDESVDFDTTQNLFIEGDNLDALKLLQETYLGQVKMIYIDPPYNTGKDFVYKDNFAETTQEYLERSGQKDEDGNKLKVNTESNGRYHSDWLTMMYSRLKIARNLLSNDGVIFVSIDENEVSNLTTLLREILGPDQFVGQLIRATGTTTGQDGTKMGSSYDTVICFAKSHTFNLDGVPLAGKDLDRFNNDDADGRGKYALLQMRKTGNADRKSDRENMFYPISAPDGTDVYPIGPTNYLSRWRFGKKSYHEVVNDGLIVWKELEGSDFDTAIDAAKSSEAEGFVTKWKPYVKYYLADRTKQLSNLLTSIDGNKKGSIELKSTLNTSQIFSNPKPIEFIKLLTSVAADSSAIILDFFAGSATTGHAVMKLNAEDGGNRKYICVQLPEVTDEKSEARKAGYDTIAEIAKERLRRAGKKIKEEHPDWEGDTGFRVLKIDTTSMKDVYYRPKETVQGELGNFISNLKEDRSSEDLLFQVMLDMGVPLDLRIERQFLPPESDSVLPSGESVGQADSGVEIFVVGQNALVACFAERLTEETIRGIAKLQPLRVVLKDAAFGSDADKINAEQIRKHFAPESTLRVL